MDNDRIREIAKDIITTARSVHGHGEEWIVRQLTGLVKEQDRDTRHACAEAIAYGAGKDGKIWQDLAHNVIMNCDGGLK